MAETPSALYDSFLLDTIPADGNPLLPAGSGDSITFNDFGLSNANIIVTSLEEEQAPERSIKTSGPPYSDGEIIEDDRFKRKIITLKGIVIDEAAQALESRLDNIKRYLKGKEKDLKIQRLGLTERVYKATLQNTNAMFTRGRRINTCQFNFSFLCVDPFARSATIESQGLESVTGEANIEITNLGNYFADPEFILIFATANNVSQITLKNNTTGDEVEINETISAGDVLEIDTIQKEVRLNGSAVGFNGKLWQLQSGANSITIETTSTSHEYTLTAKHYKTWL